MEMSFTVGLQKTHSNRLRQADMQVLGSVVPDRLIQVKATAMEFYL